MNLNSILNGISIGKDTSGNFKLSLEGLAVRTSDGTFLAMKKDRLLDVSELTIDGADGFVYRLPVQKRDVERGDLIITSENPFSVVFVDGVENDGSVKGVDPGTHERVEYIPPTNVLVDVHLYVKVVSLLGGFAFDKGTEALIPLLLLGSKGGGASNDFLTALLISQAFGGKTSDNKLLPFLLLSGGTSGTLENVLLLQALTGGGGHLSRLFAPEAKQSKP